MDKKEQLINIFKQLYFAISLHYIMSSTLKNPPTELHICLTQKPPPYGFGFVDNCFSPVVFNGRKGFTFT